MGGRKSQRAVGLLDTGAASTCMDERMYKLLDPKTYMEFPCEPNLTTATGEPIVCKKKININCRMIDFEQDSDGRMVEGPIRKHG